MKDDPLYLDSTSSKKYKYFSDCLNLFIPEYLKHDPYPYNGTQSAGTKEISDRKGNAYIVWLAHFNRKPNQSNFYNELLNDSKTIHERNTQKNILFEGGVHLPRLVFSDYPNKNEYRFIGLFELDQNRSKPYDRWYDKIADVVDFSQNPPRIHYFKEPIPEAEIKELEKSLTELEEIKHLDKTEKEIIAKARVGQQGFRERLLRKYGSCIICGLSNRKLLRASHIKDWRFSDNEERLDVNNGLLLCAQHDALFDGDLISFDENGKIMISEYLSDDDKKIAGISNDLVIEMNDKTKSYMRQHNEHIKKRMKDLRFSEEDVVISNNGRIGIITRIDDKSVKIAFKDGNEAEYRIESTRNGQIKHVF